MGIFNGLHFNVNEKVFWEVFKHPDKGFGYCAAIEKSELTEIQVDTLDFLIRCKKKKLLGTITVYFKTDGIGEINKLERRIEGIKLEKGKYLISAEY